MFSRKPSDTPSHLSQSPNAAPSELSTTNQRRRFLIAASAGALLGGWNIAGPGAGTGLAQDRGRRNDPINSRSSARSGEVRLVPNPNANLFRVRVDLDVEGNVNLAANPLVNRKVQSKLPVKSSAKFDYEERYRRPDGRRAATPNTLTEDPVTYAERYYHEASANSELSKLKQSRDLRPLVKSTIVRRETLPELLYANEDYFTRDELDLLRLPVSSIGIDYLLPSGPVSVGTKYRPTPEALASAFNLTSVDASEIEAEIVSINAREAKIQFRGNADGSVDGVPTMLRTVGKLTFDRTDGVCKWLAMAIHETRDVGIAEPGFDVAATVKILRKPMDAPVGLESKLPAANVTDPIPQDRLYVDLHSDRIGFAALMSRDWRMMSDVPGNAMMRMVRHDRSLAQCDFRGLASLEPGKQWTLEAFTQDVKQTLGKQMTELVDADERVSPVGLRVLRVTAVGAVQGVPIHWVLMHFSDDSGRRMQATFTLEADQVEAFAGSDLQLSSSLRMTHRNIAPTGAGGESDPKPADKSQELTQAEKKTEPTTRIAEAISKRAEKNEVQSASDLNYSDLNYRDLK